MSARLTVIVPTYSRVDLLMRLLESLASQTLQDIRVIVVDDASPIDVRSTVHRRFPDVEVVRNPNNRFFAASANTGLRLATSPYVAVLNDDVALTEHWSERVVRA